MLFAIYRVLKQPSKNHNLTMLLPTLLKGILKVPSEAEVEAEVEDEAGAEAETTTKAKAITNALISGLYLLTNAPGA